MSEDTCQELPIRYDLYVYYDPENPTIPIPSEEQLNTLYATTQALANSFVFQNPTTGDYYRIVLEGSAQLDTILRYTN